MDRRDFVKALGVAGGSVVGLEKLRAQQNAPGNDMYGILIDTTRCVGCRTCEDVCASAHGLPSPNLDNASDLEKERKLSEPQWTVVNRYATAADLACDHHVEPSVGDV